MNDELLDKLMRQYIANFDNYWRCYRKGLPAPEPLPLPRELEQAAVAKKPVLRLVHSRD